jgi:hypothetical protein
VALGDGAGIIDGVDGDRFGCAGTGREVAGVRARVSGASAGVLVGASGGSDGCDATGQTTAAFEGSEAASAATGSLDMVGLPGARRM